MGSDHSDVYITDSYNYGNVISSFMDALEELCLFEYIKKTEGCLSPNICISNYDQKSFFNIPCESMNGIYKYTTPCISSFYSDIVCNIESPHLTFILVNNIFVYNITNFHWSSHDMRHRSIQFIFYSLEKDVKEFNILYTNKFFSHPYRIQIFRFPPSMSKHCNLFDRDMLKVKKYLSNNTTPVIDYQYKPNLLLYDYQNNIKHHIKYAKTIYKTFDEITLNK